MTPSDALQVKDSDMVVLLAGSFDPPTNDWRRAAVALSALAGVRQVWLSPLHGPLGKRAFDFCNVMCVDACSMDRVQLGCCSIGIDKSIQSASGLAAACRASFPNIKFKLASIGPDVHEDSEKVFVVSFRPCPPLPSGAFDEVVLGGGRQTPSRTTVSAPIWTMLGNA